MENNGLENEEKVNILMQFVVSHLPLFQPLIPTKTKKTNKFRTGWSITYKKKVEAVNRSVTKDVAFQNLAIF